MLLLSSQGAKASVQPHLTQIFAPSLGRTGVRQGPKDATLVDYRKHKQYDCWFFNSPMETCNVSNPSTSSSQIMEWWGAEQSLLREQQKGLCMHSQWHISKVTSQVIKEKNFLESHPTKRKSQLNHQGPSLSSGNSYWQTTNSIGSSCQAEVSSCLYPHQTFMDQSIQTRQIGWLCNSCGTTINHISDDDDDKGRKEGQHTVWRR